MLSFLAVACGGRTGLLLDVYELDDAGDTPPPALDPGPQIVVGSAFSCWRRDGIVQCWGTNVNGNLGDGTIDLARPTPAPVLGLADVMEVSLGESHGCARRSDGTMQCWGHNSQGEVGDGTGCYPQNECPDSVRRLPVAVLSLAAAIPMRGAGSRSCARMLDGTVRCWGNVQSGHVCDDLDAPAFSPTPVPVLDNASELGLGDLSMCARWDGEVRCCGNNNAAQLGDGTTTEHALPGPVLGLSDVRKLSVGSHHACALLSDGTARCWGLNMYGALGDGTTQNRSVPVQVAGLHDAVDIVPGVLHTCAILQDATAWCWGSNASGQLGDGTTTDRLSPTPVIGLQGVVVEIALGFGHTCARLDSGEVFCWGSNNNGQVGDGTYTDRATPTAVDW